MENLSSHQEAAPSQEEKERASQMEFIEKMFGGDLPLYLAGGYAEEALLGGEPSLHHDVDGLALRKDREQIERALGESGATFREVKEAGSDGAYKLIVNYKDAQADIALLDGGEDEDCYIDVNAQGERYRVHIDPADLNFSAARIGNATVKTVSPAALMKMRNAVSTINRFPPRAKDATAQARLKEKFFSEEKDDGTFMPRIEKIT